MLNKHKANNEIDEIFSLAESTANIPMPLPIYIDEVRFELLFFYFFLYDYRKYYEYDSKYRNLLLDVFLEKVSKEMTGDDVLKNATILYNIRIESYFKMINMCSTIGDFLTHASKYIEVMAKYLQEKNQFCIISFDIIDDAINEIESNEIGKLSSNIAMSISMNSIGIL